MNTCLTNGLPSGSRRSGAVETAAEKHRKACAARVQERENKVLNAARIQNGKHPAYQNG